MSQEIKQLMDVLDHEWGTIGPKSLQAANGLAECCGTHYGILLFSASAALEAVLRGQNIGYGDQVLMAAYGDPMEAMTTALVGAAPVFSDIDGETLTISVENAAAQLTEKTRAVIMGPHTGRADHVKAMAEFCKEKNLFFILNLSDAFGAMAGDVPAAQYADAAIINLEEGKLLDAGLAGAMVMNSEEIFQRSFSHHNCGRPLGAGSTLDFDDVLGGDLRTAEWQAVLILERLAQYKQDWMAGKRTDPGYQLMYNQPVWQSAYYQKQTGSQLQYEDADYPESIEAAKK